MLHVTYGVNEAARFVFVMEFRLMANTSLGEGFNDT
jgi:hypothetical protein